MAGLRPFWRYYGGKWRIAPRYPRPQHRTIIEPFAGAAGYSLRYPDRDVILVEKYHVIAEIWRYLIGADPAEIRAIPCVDAVADLPSWVPQAARWLVGFCSAAGRQQPASRLSPMLATRREESAGRVVEGWTAGMRERVASQVLAIRHWRIIEGDYTAAPDVAGTWFIDTGQGPGSLGVCCCRCSVVRPRQCTVWCQGRSGQVIVCESPTATWLPFAQFLVMKGLKLTRSHEAIWTQGEQSAQRELQFEAHP